MESGLFENAQIIRWLIDNDDRDVGPQCKMCKYQLACRVMRIEYGLDVCDIDSEGAREPSYS